MSNVYSPDRTNKTSQAFRPFYQTDINADVSYNLKEAQYSSKKLSNETAIGKAITDRVIQFTLGQGLFPQSAPERSLLNVSDEEYKRFTSQAESFWRYITDTKDFDYYKRNTFVQLQRIALRNILDSGDVLLHRYYRSKYNAYKPAIQLISGNSVYSPTTSLDTKKRIGGVELDEKGKERGYWIAQSDDNLHDTFSSKLFYKYNRGFEEFSLIALNIVEANQVRGIPLLASVRDAILDTTVFTRATIQKALVQSLFTVFIEHEPEVAENNTFYPTIENLSRQAQELTGKEDISDIGFALSSGNAVSLAQGEKVKLVESTAPSTDYGAFIDSMLDQIGAAMSIPREILKESFTASFSASRGSLGCAEKGFTIYRKDMADNFCQPVWEQVTDYGIRIGEINAPGYMDGNERVKKAWLSATWIGQGGVSINPVQEVNAYKTAVEAGFCTHEMAVRNLYGKDFEETADRLKKEKEMIDNDSNGS